MAQLISGRTRIWIHVDFWCPEDINSVMQIHSDFICVCVCYTFFMCLKICHSLLCSGPSMHTWSQWKAPHSSINNKTETWELTSHYLTSTPYKCSLSPSPFHFIYQIALTVDLWVRVPKQPRHTWSVLPKRLQWMYYGGVRKLKITYKQWWST